ncbi:nucleolar protein 58 [Anopheles ziemanni]|uniref:nucleolar protein 58 n=1 Tax=Anopheles ziemanni TaxID=345580 RepID=UPI00265A5870|nr:nucleolar protein 58 isoform X2 [Anopheles coustani]XP_058174587.1 nucleolar protein 58 [Anopheles ziemanni]
MFILYETPAGYAIFKLLDDNKFKEIDNLYLEFETPEKASKIVKLKHFEKFADTTEALSAATAAVEGKVSKTLKKALKKLVVDDVQNELLVADAKLGNAIKDKLSLQCVANTSVQELMRCIRSQSENLLSGLPKKEMTAMSLGLAHSLSRYKLKFSPDKIDTMIVQAQCLLDDLDKELNNYMMRVREWYGWHFPELGKILTDNVAYIKTIKLVGMRDNMAETDLSDILIDELEQKVKEAAEISMGTEISEEDITNIQNLCDEILSIHEYRSHLSEYLKTRMMAMAPNLTVLVGETVGARLIAHAGSLVNLAKHPASTVQILGSEKALFRALKTKKDTPKYGLIYHASMVTTASIKNKGRISRSLAAKASLATRVDAFGDDVTMQLGIDHRAKLETRLRILEEGKNTKLSGGKAKAKLQKFHATSEVKTFKVEKDSTLPSTSKLKIKAEEDADSARPAKKKKVQEVEVKMEEEEAVDEPETTESAKKKKKKKKVKTEDQPEEEAVESVVTEVTSSAKKSKKSKKTE